MSRSGFSIDALLTNDSADTDDVLLEQETTEDKRKRTTAAPLTVNWPSYGRSLDVQTDGDVRRQLGSLPLHRSYDRPVAMSHSNNSRSGYDSGFVNASSRGASILDGFWNDRYQGGYFSDVGRDSTLDLERRRPSPQNGDMRTGSGRLDHFTGGKDEEEDEEQEEEERNNLVRSSTGYVQRGTSMMNRINLTNNALQSTKSHATGSANQQPALQTSTLCRPWEQEKIENSLLTTSTPSSNAPMRRPWEVSPVHNTHPLDLSADNHSYLGQASQDSGYPSFETMPIGPYAQFRSPANAPSSEVIQVLEDSQDEKHIESKRIKKTSRTNTVFSDETVEVMESWYVANYDKPYPTDEQIHLLATRACLTLRQARKWLANRRVRSHNTLAYNNNVHPKRARRLEKNRQALLGLTASLSQNSREGSGSKIPSVNVPLTPANIDSIYNSMNHAGEISANIQESFPSRNPALHFNRIAMDQTSLYPRLSFSSGLKYSESNQTIFGNHRQPLLNESTSTLTSSLQNGVFRQQIHDPQQQHFMSFGGLSQPALAAPSTYLPYNNYLCKEPRR